LVLATTLVDTQQTLKSAMQIAIQLTREITSNHMRVGTEGIPEPPKNSALFTHEKGSGFTSRRCVRKPFCF